MRLDLEIRFERVRRGRCSVCRLRRILYALTATTEESPVALASDPRCAECAALGRVLSSPEPVSLHFEDGAGTGERPITVAPLP